MTQSLLTFSVLFPEDGTEILNLILLCDMPSCCSQQGGTVVICIEKNLLKDVLKLTVSEPHKFNFSALKG